MADIVRLAPKHSVKPKAPEQLEFDQYYPGGVMKQMLDWLEARKEDRFSLRVPATGFPGRK